MSHTDKTRPFDVKVADPHNRRYVEETHDHRAGICDFTPRYVHQDWRRRQPNCGLRPKLSYAGSGELLARSCGSWCSVCGPEMNFEGVVRAKLRQLKRKMVKTRVEDLDDLDEIFTDRRSILFERGQHW